MSSTIYELHGQVAVITMNNPPVNGLGFDLRRDIVEGLARADADANVKVVVLIGSPRAFSGGADIREFGSPKATAEPNLNTVIRRLENARKPVVAAIGGARSEEHTSELQSQSNLVCRLLLEKKKKNEKNGT